MRGTSSKCIKKQNRDILNFQEPLQECALEFNEGCSTEECEECHDVPGLKCSVEFSEHYSDVEREFCHDEMSQECATEYSEECSTEMKEQCIFFLNFSHYECILVQFDKDFNTQTKMLDRGGWLSQTRPIPGSPEGDNNHH